MSEVTAETGGAPPILRYAGIVAVLLVGGIHLQQYDGLLQDVPTIGTLFLLNAISAAVVALAIAGLRGRLGALAALGGAGIAAGSLVSIMIARYGTLFDYQEPSYRAAVVVSIVFEVVALVVLVTLASREAKRA